MNIEPMKNVLITLLAAAIAAVGALWLQSARSGGEDLPDGSGATTSPPIHSTTASDGGPTGPSGPKPGTAAATTSINLYYYSETRDRERNGGTVACDPAAVVAVPRIVPQTNTPVQDAIKLLIQGNLTAADRAAGLSTEFPRAGFSLKGAALSGGLLTLEFTEVPGFTSGGACRTTLLSEQVRKTALQFPGVREVRFRPEGIFQP